MQQMQKRKKKFTINENVSDKNMCDTFDTPTKRPLAAFMAAVAVCVSFFFIAYFCVSRRCTLCVCVCLCECVLCVLVWVMFFTTMLIFRFVCIYVFLFINFYTKCHLRLLLLLHLHVAISIAWLYLCGNLCLLAVRLLVSVYACLFVCVWVVMINYIWCNLRKRFSRTFLSHFMLRAAVIRKNFIAVFVIVVAVVVQVIPSVAVLYCCCTSPPLPRPAFVSGGTCWKRNGREREREQGTFYELVFNWIWLCVGYGQRHYRHYM